MLLNKGGFVLFPTEESSIVQNNVLKFHLETISLFICKTSSCVWEDQAGSAVVPVIMAPSCPPGEQPEGAISGDFAEDVMT